MGKIVINITLIRHGQVAGNSQKKFIGITDEPLTLKGREDISKFKYEEAELIFVSPLLRCRETAEIIYPNREQIVIDNLREMNFGIFENKCHDELKEDAYYKAWMETGGRVAMPKGEELESFLNRIKKGFEQVLFYAYDYCIKEEKNEINVSAIIHGGSMMALQSSLGIRGFYDKIYDNGECLKIRVETNGKDYSVLMSV